MNMFRDKPGIPAHSANEAGRQPKLERHADKMETFRVFTNTSFGYGPTTFIGYLHVNPRKIRFIAGCPDNRGNGKNAAVL